MKTKNYFLSLILGLSFFTGTAKADVTKTVGTTGADFTTLGAAFTDINTTNPGLYSGVVSLQIIDNTSEAAVTTLTATGNWTTLNIYPTVTGKTIGGNIVGAFIYLSAANNVIIDGRLHNADGSLVGSTKDLTITNTNVSASAFTIRFQAGASNNTVKYCTIKGSSIADYIGTIYFGTGGNSNNTISNNLITNAGSRPQLSIGANGGTTANNNNTISNNEFADCLSGALYTRGIRVQGLNTNWTISGNSFYETTPLVPTATVGCNVIEVAGTTTTGCTISGNFIGGSAALCGGTAMTKTSDFDNTFSAIMVNGGISPATTVSNNTIQNINWSNAGSTTWTGISVSGGVEIITGNTIGAPTGNGSISVTNMAPSANYSVYGVQVYNATTGGSTVIDNNKIGSITTNTYLTTLYGMFCQGTTPLTITNNIIGSTTTGNSLYANAPLAAGQVTYGIRYQNTVANIISGNTIANITNACSTANSTLYGISAEGGTNMVSGNFITKLSTPNSTATYLKVYGINITVSAASVVSNYYNNIISLGETGIPAMYHGINELNTVSTATTNIFFNTVYIGGTQDAVWSNSYCIRSANTSAYIKSIQNNILVNARNSTGIGVWSANYALFATTGRVTAGADFTCNYNDYFVSGTNSKLGSYAAVDITALPIVTGKTGNDANSLAIDPLFANAGGTLATDYRTNATVSLPGTPIAGITTDFTAITSRGGTPRMGALESSFTTKLNTIESTTNPRIICNSVGIAVPLTGESNIELYTSNGLLIEKSKANGMYTRSLSNGMYIISINGKASKFIKQ